MGSQITKRCHWVSQSYLRAFAADADQRKIWRYSKTAGEPELKPIEKVAVKFHLYAPKGADGRRDDMVEKKLAELENWFGKPIWAAVCNDFPDLTWEPLRKMIALLVATTYIRNPTQFEVWKDLHRSWANQLSQFEKPPTHVTINGARYEVDPSDWNSFRRAGEEEMKAGWNNFIATCADIATCLLKMRWAVVYCDQPAFVTSDNPVQVIHPSLTFRGINNPDTVVSFPLSPTRILLMDHRHSETNGAFYPLRHDPASDNGLTWRNAIDHMYSPRHPYQVCAEILANGEKTGFK